MRHQAPRPACGRSARPSTRTGRTGALLVVLLLAGCVAAGPAGPAGESGPSAPDPSGAWHGRLSLYSAEINDFVMELRLTRTEGARTGRARIAITDEPGELHEYAPALTWDQDGAALAIDFGETGPDAPPGLVFGGEFVGDDRVVGRLDGWGIEDARFVLTRRAD